jgi:hypothetical protein
MTTKRIPIGSDVMFDTGVYVSRYDAELSLTNVKKQMCIVMPAPTGSDIGFEFSVRVPDDYASGPKLFFRGVIDGTPAGVFGVGVQLLEVNAAATIDAAYEVEDVANNSTWTGYADEEEYELSVTLTPSASLTPGRTLYLRVYRDDSVDTQTIPFLLNPQTSGFEYTTT